MARCAASYTTILLPQNFCFSSLESCSSKTIPCAIAVLIRPSSRLVLVMANWTRSTCADTFSASCDVIRPGRVARPGHDLPGDHDGAQSQDPIECARARFFNSAQFLSTVAAIPVRALDFTGRLCGCGNTKSREAHLMSVCIPRTCGVASSIVRLSGGSWPCWELRSWALKKRPCTHCQGNVADMAESRWTADLGMSRAAARRLENFSTLYCYLAAAMRNSFTPISLPSAFKEM